MICDNLYNGHGNKFENTLNNNNRVVKMMQVSDIVLRDRVSRPAVR